jgi:cytochrome c553
MKFTTAFVTLSSALALTAACSHRAMTARAAQDTQASSTSPDNRAQVDRGRYLVTAIGCGDCHTPKKMGPHGPEPDMARLLAGHPEQPALPPPPAPSGPWIAAATWDTTAWSGPWGVSYPANLTPDQNTGLGIWTEKMFIDAMRTGRHMGTSRPILPPMPWQSFGTMSDEDLKAIYAYLRTLPPIHNRVPDPLPPAAQGGSHASN